MMRALMAYSNSVYWIQQCVVFVLWMGLLKLFCGELRALWGEKKRTHQNLPRRSEAELGRTLRESTAVGRRAARPCSWRIETETPQRARVQSGKRWSRVGTSR